MKIHEIAPNLIRHLCEIHEKRCEIGKIHVLVAKKV